MNDADATAARAARKAEKRRRESEVGKRERKMSRAYEGFDVDTQVRSIITTKSPRNASSPLTSTSSASPTTPKSIQSPLAAPIPNPSQSSQSPKTAATTSTSTATTVSPPSALQPQQQPPETVPQKSAVSPMAAVRGSKAPEPKSRGGMSADAPEPLRQMYTIVKSLMRQPDAEAFLRPVDPVALCIPDYPTVIDRPMDLGTVRKRLESWSASAAASDSDGYAGFEAAGADVRLTFTNARVYNPPGHPVHDCAVALGNVFERYYDRIRERAAGAVDLPFEVNGARVQAEVRRAMEEQVRAMRHNGPAIVAMWHEERLAKLQRKAQPIEQTAPAIVPVESAAAAAAPASEAPVCSVTEEERTALVDRINQLSGKRLAKVIEVIQEHSVVLRRALAAAQVDTCAVVEIDLEVLGDATLRAVISELDKPRHSHREKSQIPPHNRAKEHSPDDVRMESPGDQQSKKPSPSSTGSALPSPAIAPPQPMAASPQIDGASGNVVQPQPGSEAIVLRTTPSQPSASQTTTTVSPAASPMMVPTSFLLAASRSFNTTK